MESTRDQTTFAKGQMGADGVGTRPASSFFVKVIICGVDGGVLAGHVSVNTTVGSRVVLSN